MNNFKKRRTLKLTLGLALFFFLTAIVFSGRYLYKQYQVYQEQQQVLKSFNQTMAKGNAQIKGDSSSFNIQNQELNVVGAITIPKIAMKLPIFNNSSTAALEIGAGWLPASSKLGGGKTTHALVDGHTGKSAPLFTRIRELQKGDKIYLRVKDKVLEYQVISSKTYDPTYVADLQPVKGKDLLTLITCTPLFINTERLHVTAKRVTYDNGYHEPSSALNWLFEHLEIVVIAGLFVLILLLIRLFVSAHQKRKLRG